jgi:hypothetical protein
VPILAVPIVFASGTAGRALVAVAVADGAVRHRGAAEFGATQVGGGVGDGPGQVGIEKTSLVEVGAGQVCPIPCRVLQAGLEEVDPAPIRRVGRGGENRPPAIDLRDPGAFGNDTRKILTGVVALLAIGALGRPGARQGATAGDRFGLGAAGVAALPLFATLLLIAIVAFAAVVAFALVAALAFPLAGFGKTLVRVVAEKRRPEEGDHHAAARSLCCEQASQRVKTIAIHGLILPGRAPELPDLTVRVGDAPAHPYMYLFRVAAGTHSPRLPRQRCWACAESTDAITETGGTSAV